MADISHLGGLVAAWRGDKSGRRGFRLRHHDHAQDAARAARRPHPVPREACPRVDASVFPGLQGGPHMNAIAGAAITFDKATQPAFRRYAERVLANARAMADTFQSRQRHARHRRNGQSPDGHRHREELRPRRTPRRTGARSDRHCHQQADHPRRSQPALAAVGFAPRFARRTRRAAWAKWKCAASPRGWSRLSESPTTALSSRASGPRSETLPSVFPCRACPRRSDRLEVALQLPLGHGALVLAHLPVARAHVVIDERLRRGSRARPCSPRARAVASRERARQRRERAPRRPSPASPGGRRRLDLVLDAPEPGGEARRHRDVRVDVGRGLPVLEARRLGVAGADDADRARAVLDAPASR